MPRGGTSTARDAFARGSHSRRRAMMIDVVLVQPLIALIIGILILIMPRLLNFLVAIYLILVGVTGLWPHVLH
jgi:hypothetical protein